MSPRRLRLGEVIRTMRKEAGLEQTQLASRVNEITRHPRRTHLTQPRISDLERGSEPLERDLANLMAIDVATGHEPGHALELAGYIRRAEVVDLEVAILTYPAPLDQAGREALIGVLRALSVRHVAADVLPRTPGMAEAEDELRRATQDPGVS
jgi:transcriptional regulator with XRE-family HTH domain